MEGYNREEFMAIFGLFLGETIDLRKLIDQPELFASSILTTKIRNTFSNTTLTNIRANSILAERKHVRLVGQKIVENPI